MASGGCCPFANRINRDGDGFLADFLSHLVGHTKQASQSEATHHDVAFDHVDGLDFGIIVVGPHVRRPVRRATRVSCVAQTFSAGQKFSLPGPAFVKHGPSSLCRGCNSHLRVTVIRKVICRSARPGCIGTILNRTQMHRLDKPSW